MGLDALTERLGDEREWSRELSGGEQQRLSIARALLYQPDTLYLDEATNQLDDASACRLLELIRQALPRAMVIGISHQPTVQRLFQRSLNLESAPLAEAVAV